MNRRVIVDEDRFFGRDARGTTSLLLLVFRVIGRFSVTLVGGIVPVLVAQAAGRRT